MTPPDLHLIEEFKNGNRQAIESIYEYYKPSVLRFIVMLRSSFEIELFSSIKWHVLHFPHDLVDFLLGEGFKVSDLTTWLRIVFIFRNATIGFGVNILWVSVVVWSTGKCSFKIFGNNFSDGCQVQTNIKLGSFKEVGKRR